MPAKNNLTNLKTFSRILTAIVFLSGLFGIALFAKTILGMGYDDQHWKIRKHSSSSEDSKRRGVFVKPLNYKIENYHNLAFNLDPFIERAFTHGKTSVKQTIVMNVTNYPYTFTFNERPFDGASLHINEDDLSKFDSSNYLRGYLKNPFLPDTIRLFFVPAIGGDSVSIRVW